CSPARPTRRRWRSATSPSASARAAAARSTSSGRRRTARRPASSRSAGRSAWPASRRRSPRRSCAWRPPASPTAPAPTPAGRRRPPPPRRWGAGGSPAPSQRHVGVLALRQLLPLGAEEVEAGDQLHAGVGRVDDVVDVAPLGRVVGVGVLLGVLLDQLGPPGG